MATKKARAERPQKQVALIVPSGPSSTVHDDEGGELQTGAFARLLGYAKVEKSLDEMKADIAKLSDTVSVIASAMQTKQATGFEVKSIEIGLAINAEGSIGVATAGVEASITVTLERK